MKRNLAGVLGILALVTACAGGTNEGPADPGIDGVPEPSPEVVGEAVADPAAELPVEVPLEVATDPLADPAPDPGIDPATDPGVPVKTLAVIENGKSAHAIVVEPGASASERQAGLELQSYLEQVTGAKLPILDAQVTPGQPVIVVGRGATATLLGVTPDAAALGEQGFTVRVVPPNVVIAGTPGAGTMYGVHRFLEEFAGVRWVAPGVTTVPKSPDLRVPESLDRTVRPAFGWRSMYYEWPGGDDAFRAHQAVNSGDTGPDATYGLSHWNDGQCHTYFQFVSPDEFFDTHPEYFSEIGGVRVRDGTQLCLTNPDVLDLVTDRMLQRMAQSPTARQHNFSQMDWYNNCQCPKCKAMNQQYGTPGGTQFWFVNQLAERTAKVFPDKQIGTLAYTFSEQPPTGLVMHPNVAVWLCHMYPSCDSHAIQTCPLNATYRQRAEAWSKITGHLYIWHYIVDFTHYYEPFPNFGGLVQDLRFYQGIGVEGLFLQGMAASGGGGEFSLLRPFFTSKLAWDPQQDPSAVMDDFLKGYYGDAGAPIRAWIDLLQKKVDDGNLHMHLYTNPAQGYLPDDVLAQGAALFDEAEALVAGDALLLDRVQVARMPLAYARFFPRNGYSLADGKLKWNPGMATFDEVTAFIDQMNAHGFTSVREAVGGTDTLVLMYAIMGADQDVVTLQNDALTVDVVPGLAGRALRITHRATGQAVTAYDVRKGLFFPFSGGLEERVGASATAMGWVEPAGASAVSARSVTVTSTTFDGVGLKRTYTLDAVEPVLHVATTVTNPGSSARSVVPRAHLELDLGDVHQTRMAFRQRSGTTVDEDMTSTLAGMREGRHFYDQDVPAGTWTFSGTKGLKVTQTFDDAATDQAWVYAYPDALNEVEVEVWAKAVTLQAGESVTVTRDLRVEAAGK